MRRDCARCLSHVPAISHDRWFLDRVAAHILAFEGESQVVLFNGNYQEYQDDKKNAWAKKARARTVCASSR